MFRASNAHLQEDTVVYVQHMVLSLSTRVRGCLSVHSVSENRQATTNSHREWQYHMLHVYNCILLKKSTWGSKHVEENSILWINNNQCIKLIINIYSQFHASIHLLFFLLALQPPSGVVFYSPLAGFRLLACEVSWSHTTTRHSR